MPSLDPLLPWALALPAAALAFEGAKVASGFVVRTVETQQPLSWPPERIAVLLRDTVLGALVRWVGPLAPGLHGPPDHTAGDRTPVLIVPCPTHNRAATWLLTRFLVQRGHPVHTCPLSHGEAELADRAEELEAHLDALCEATGAARCDLVVVGLAGLAAGWMLAHRGGEARIRRVVSVGTPWRGTRMAVFLGGLDAQACRVGAHQLDGLVPTRVPLVSVWCPDDPRIVPATSARGIPETSVAVVGAGHLGLLWSARSLRAIDTALSDPLPAQAPRGPAQPESP